MEDAGLPFAPIRRPEDLLDDPHLLATGGLVEVRVPDGPLQGRSVKTTPFPFTLEGQRPAQRLDPPRMGAHTRELLDGLGYDPAQQQRLFEQAVVA
jgi:crotonobetainyl-CoA:carnitine CoA-transferase CaiB-like acyl-CoA transferase